MSVAKVAYVSELDFGPKPGADPPEDREHFKLGFGAQDGSQISLVPGFVWADDGSDETYKAIKQQVISTALSLGITGYAFGTKVVDKGKLV